MGIRSTKFRSLSSTFSGQLSKLTEFVASRNTGGGTNAPNGFTATGGTLSYTRSGYVVHTFTTSEPFNVTSGSLSVEYVVIGGGGGGSGGAFGASFGPGGASGTLRTGTLAVTPGPYTVTIGGGGAASSPPQSTGGTGQPSVFGPVTAPGGGGGPPNGPGGSNADYSGAPNQGIPGSGGAGSSANGNAWRGGAGTTITITGNPQLIGQGADSGYESPDGSSLGRPRASSGPPGSGSGGGGSPTNGGHGNGGSGVVIIAYPYL